MTYFYFTCFILLLYMLVYIFSYFYFTFLYLEHRPAKNAKTFKNITMLNKTSLNAYLPLAHAVFKKDFGVYYTP